MFDRPSGARALYSAEMLSLNELGTTRTSVTDQLMDVAVDGEAVALVVSELLTNAFMHAKPPIILQLLQDDHTTIVVVSDGSDEQPAIRQPFDGTAGGFGLNLIPRAATQWGATVTPSGKDVWATFRHRIAPGATSS